MKKLLALGALMTQSVSLVASAGSCAEVTSKFFVELQGGTTIPRIGKVSASSLEGTQPDLLVVVKPNLYAYYPQSAGPSWGGPGLTALLNIGYDCKIDRSNVVVGAFLGGGISKTSTQLAVQAESINSQYTAPSFNAPFYLSTAGRFQAGFRLGFVASGSILPVFTLGWSTFNSKIRAPRISSIFVSADPIPGGLQGTWQNANVKPSVGKWINCLMVGFGLEFNLSPGLILGFTSNVHIGSTPTYSFKKFTNLTQSSGKADVISVRGQPVLLEMLATLKYAMPTCR